MAPKKKTKKPAANPARGFATTSTASKSKPLDEEAPEQQEKAESGPAVAEPSAQSASTSKPSGPKEKQISELTPEQLEARLEEADLQNLVDANRERCLKDVARYVSRLKTERKLARGTAERLELRKWVPEDLSTTMMDLISQQPTDNTVLSDPQAPVRVFELAEDVLVVRIWALRKALRDLGFMPEKSEEAIINLISDARVFVAAQTKTTKETLWGLEECIEWLALNCEQDELPGYDNYTTPALQRNLQAKMHELEQAARKRAVKQKAANKQAKQRREAEANEITAPQESEEEHHSSDSDIEPVRQREKYLQFKTRLHQRRPDLTEVNVNRGKKTKGPRKPSPKPADPKASKLIRRIRALEKDLLFDVEEATQRWAELRIRLVAEEAEKRRGEKTNGNQSTGEADVKTKSTGEAAAEDDGSIGLGEFFASLPDPTSEPNALNGVSAVTTDGSKVFIRDFGTPAGMSPRRVLEEACRARNSGAKVNYNIVSATSFHCRHEVSVRWSKDQDILSGIELKGIEQHFLIKQTSMKMKEIACPDMTQSESYVSVIALFQIFASSQKEEKVYLRLPAVWRDLWAECAVLRKEQTDAADREELRGIRQIVQKSYDGARMLDALEPKNRAIRAGNDAGPDTKAAEPTFAPILDPETIAQDWNARATSNSFISMLHHRKGLPIWAYKDELMDMIDNNQAIILCGETGCGKSTQLPAYLLEHLLSQGQHCKIYCTEPRRISALSLARRVSEELGERRNDVGTSRSLVGYAIRLESQVTAQTRLVYATTGIVMRMLERGNELEGITHIVLDEVHERNIDSDFLLVVLKRIMLKRPELRVVLMSATVDAEQFAAYLGGVPIVNIPGRTYPVDTRFLEDAIEESGYGLVKDPRKREAELDVDDDDSEDAKPSIGADDLSSYSINTQNVIKQFNEYRIDYELVLQLLETVARKPKFAGYSKAILVFLPGMAEIRRLNDMLVGNNTFIRGWDIIPLHSTISTEDQEKAFVVPPRGIRKIVLATNIAETGITIPDVTCVIDTGKHKEMRFDERRQLSRLIEAFISRANAKQRRGRAGRVQDGLCFHLFTKQRHDRLMPDAQTPEMLRLSLQDLALRVRICKLGEIEQVLAEALSPPLAKNVRRAIDSLIEVRALTADQQLTILGRRLASLPLDVYLGKLILLSSVSRCLDAGLTIAAILSAKSPFTAPVNARAQADQARLTFKKGESDLMTVYNAYCAWRRICQTNGSSEQHFCRKNFLSPPTMHNIEDLKAQLATALAESGFLQLDPAAKASLNRVRYSSRQRHFVEVPAAQDVNSDNARMVNSVVAWSFYPKLLVREGNGYRNVANNQAVSIYPGSVNRHAKPQPHFVSYYHIMQASSGSRAYHAHETSAAEDLAVALACGEAEFKPYAGVAVVDGNRLRFAAADWQSLLLLRAMRENVQAIVAATMRNPRKELPAAQQGWFEAWQRVFAKGGGA